MFALLDINAQMLQWVGQLLAVLVIINQLPDRPAALSVQLVIIALFKQSPITLCTLVLNSSTVRLEALYLYFVLMVNYVCPLMQAVN